MLNMINGPKRSQNHVKNERITVALFKSIKKKTLSLIQIKIKVLSLSGASHLREFNLK